MKGIGEHHRSKARLTTTGWAAALLTACAAGGSTTTGQGALNEAGSGAGASGGVLFGDLERGGAAARGCNELQVAFEGRTPTALLLVDRSSSQWDGYPNHNWEPVKAGLLSVVEAVQAEMNLGLVTYTGQNGGTCPDLLPGVAQVDFRRNNLEAIRTALEAVDSPPYKGETPTSLAIDAVLPDLLAQPNTGQKFILLVTDGEPDFCNDPDRVCAMDAVVGSVQRAQAQGVSTTVFGLTRDGVQLSRRHLQDVANAGAGLGVGRPEGIGRIEDFSQRCNTPAAGTYSETPGQAAFYQAQGTDSFALEEALQAIVAGLRSCTYDLEGAVKIDPERASAARITIDDGPALSLGDPNGWRLNGDTQVELVGEACERVKDRTTRGVSFDFPCEAYVY